MGEGVVIGVGEVLVGGGLFWGVVGDVGLVFFVVVTFFIYSSMFIPLDFNLIIICLATWRRSFLFILAVLPN